MTQCSYYYHDATNGPSIRCKHEEGHIGEHEKEQVLAPQVQPWQWQVGWRKH